MITALNLCVLYYIISIYIRDAAPFPQNITVCVKEKEYTVKTR